MSLRERRVGAEDGPGGSFAGNSIAGSDRCSYGSVESDQLGRAKDLHRRRSLEGMADQPGQTDQEGIVGRRQQGSVEVGIVARITDLVVRPARRGHTDDSCFEGLDLFGGGTGRGAFGGERFVGRSQVGEVT
jgi:hypothetical protein